MNTRTATARATHLMLAALTTFAVMAGIDGLASTPAPVEQLAHTSAPVQVVVITGQRLPRS